MISRNRKLVVGVVAAVLAAAGGTTWWYLSRPAVPDPPPIPERVTDPNVRAAVAEARNGVLSEPRSAAAWGEYGLVCRANGLNDESNACFAQAARLDPADPRWPYLIGFHSLYFSPAEALPHLREAYRLATAPKFRSAARLRLAEQLQEQGSLDEAERLFAEDLRENPDGSRAQFGLAVIATTRGDPRGAIERLKPLAANPVCRKRASAILAAVYRQLGDLPAAARAEQDSARLPADLGWSDAFLAESLSKQVGYVAKLKQAEELDTKGRFGEALPFWEDLARAYPDEPALTKYGVALAKANLYPQAEDIFRSILRQNPNNGTVHYYLGRSILEQAVPHVKTGGEAGERARKMIEEAVGEFRRATELRPDYEPGYVVTGQALRLLGRLPEAEVVCRDAVRIAPQDYMAHLTLGEVLLDQGKPTDAVREAEEAVRLAPAPDPRPKELLEKAKKAAGR
jgi:tetratricopeptide (TPR) repeat protein